MNVYSNDRSSNLIDHSAASQKLNLSNIVFWLQNLCNACVHDLLRGEQPRIWQQRDRIGVLQWYAYDPMTGRSITRATENEVRIWLESVLYR